MGLGGSGFVRAVKFKEYLLLTYTGRVLSRGHRTQQAQLLPSGDSVHKAAIGALHISSE